MNKIVEKAYITYMILFERKVRLKRIFYLDVPTKPESGTLPCESVSDQHTRIRIHISGCTRPFYKSRPGPLPRYFRFISKHSSFQTICLEKCMQTPFKYIKIFWFQIVFLMYSVISVIHNSIAFCKHLFDKQRICYCEQLFP